MNFLSKFEIIKSLEDIVSADSSVLKSILSHYYGDVKSIERASQKKSFFCNSWKINFKSLKTGFIKLAIANKKKNILKEKNWSGWKLLSQQVIFERKIFESSKEGIMSFWPTKNNKAALFIKTPHYIFVVTLTEYLKEPIKLKLSRDIPIISRLLADLHVKGKKSLSSILKGNFILSMNHHKRLMLKSKIDKKKLTLIHGDIVLENIFINKDKNIWFLDWDNLRIDYPEYDLACFIRCLKNKKIDKNGDIAKLFLDNYQKYSNRKINFLRISQYLKYFDKNQKFTTSAL
jgi:hypothetical protein